MTKPLTPEQKHLRRLEKLKRWGISGTKKRAAQEFQKLIRLESADCCGMVHCVTCGFSNNWTNPEGRMDAGHWLAGRVNALRFVEDNCHPQCTKCNRWESGALERYTPWMMEKYGNERLGELRRLQSTVVKFSSLELDEMRLSFRARSKAAVKHLRGLIE